MTGFGGWMIAALGLLAGSGLAGAADLSKIDRTIGKQPAYENKPGYCLLVFGPEASTRIWLVKDGNVLYLDRNGNGDLTEAGKRLAGNAGESAGTITDSAGKNKYKIQGCNLTKVGGGKDGKEQKDYCHIAIDIDGAFRQYTFAGFADRPQDAPVVHFDGPLTFDVSGQDTILARGDKPTDLSVYLLTRGQGERLGSTVLVDHGLGIPQDAHPVVEVEFPSKEPGGKPVTAKYTLKERCWGALFHGPVRVPDEAGNGKAKVKVSFEAWKVKPVKATTTEITVGEKAADGSDGLKSVPPAKSDR